MKIMYLCETCKATYPNSVEACECEAMHSKIVNTIPIYDKTYPAPNKVWITFEEYNGSKNTFLFQIVPE